MNTAKRGALAGLAAGAALAGVWIMAASELSATLPPPVTRGTRSLEEVLAARRSVRQFGDTALGERQIAQLCWAAQGVSDAARGLRTAPSAGATYPLELYVATAQGVRRYVPARHALVEHLRGDVRRRLREAALDQAAVESAPAVFILAAAVQRTADRYGGRAERYVLIEVGHAAQNLLLQAQALGLGAVPIAAMDEQAAGGVLALPAGQQAVYLLPVGVPPR